MPTERRRFEIVADFVARHFPPPATRTVLDVGGSMGILAYHLARRGYVATVIDPRRKAVKRHFRKLAQKGGFISRLHYERRVLLPSDTADLLVGLHPDEATEALVEQAVRLRAAFVVVPCCVMPRDGVHRTFEEWCDHLRALAAATHSVHTEVLPMNGANLALWAHQPVL